MLSVYSNQRELLSSTNTVSVARMAPVDISLLPAAKSSVSFLDSYRPKLEIHVYTPDGVYLTGNYDSSFTVDNNDTSSIITANQHLSIDLLDILTKLGITRGQYKLVYNLFDNVIGSNDSLKLWISEISPSRTEVRIRLFDDRNSTLVNQYSNLYYRWNNAIKDNTYNTFLLNFGKNETYQITNIIFDNGGGSGPFGTAELVVKLYNPLPNQYVEKDQLWISEEIITTVVDNISLIPKYIPEVLNTLAGPNFTLTEFEKSSVATDFKSWNDLLGSSLSTSQQLIDAQFPSGSLSGIKLNINYRLFDNFVHFSSATERVSNFYYKLQLIEYYTSQIGTVSTINSGSSIAQTNLTDLYQKRNTIVSGFDDFEKYLFFESSDSALYTNYDVTGSISPWPKITPVSLTWIDAFNQWSTQATTWNGLPVSSDPYEYFSIQVATTSEDGQAYYNNVLELAQEYDKSNVHKLQNAIPTYLLETESETGGEELSLFVHMLGQHFDILWTYIKNLTSISTREEHPKDGMPNDLLYHVAASFGFQLLNGKSTKELWDYSLGLDANGNSNSSNVEGIVTLPGSENTKEIWRRIVNNLPYILKSKGTSRSVKALLSCFGIPSSVLTIKEYGGPSTYTDNNHYPQYVHDVYHYAWSSGTGSLSLPIGTYTNGQGISVAPNVLEFRFKTDLNYDYPIGSTTTIFTSSINNSKLQLTNNTGELGTLTYSVSGSSGSISNLSLFDNSWQHVVIDRTNNTGSFYVAKSLYGKTVYLYSASLSSAVPSFNETLYFCTGSNKFNGHLHEVRLWSGSLNAETISEHAASPSTYTYDVNRASITAGEEGAKPYDHLLQRFTLASRYIPYGTLYQLSAHPNQNVNTGYIYFAGIQQSGSVHFDGIEETYYTPSPSLGASSLYTNKVRIDSSSLDNTKRLNTKTRIEKSSLDKYSNDSNKLGIYFSPQNAINEDIFNQLGYFEIDDYIGNPQDLYNESYDTLITFSEGYWKKYNGKNDFEAYFRVLEQYDFTLFTYIKRLLPNRTNLISGLVLEPNVLERSKVRLNRKPIVTDLSYNSLITNNLVATLSGEVSNNGEGEIDNIVDINKLGSVWSQHRYIGVYKITESGSFNPILNTILNSRVNYNLQTTAYFYSSALSASLNLSYSSSLVPSDINKSQDTGYRNARYNGSKLVGSAVNVNCPDTVDGGPVVKVTKVNPNQLVFSSNQITTVNQATTGVQSKSI